MKSYNGFTPQQRNAAQSWLNRQWSAGTLERPCKCCACGQTEGIIDAHAEDYSLPFSAGKTDEFHLCFRCHMMVHCRHRNPRAWQRYRDAIAAGQRFAPFLRRNFPGFCAEHLDAWAPRLDVVGDPPERDLLGEIERYAAEKLAPRNAQGEPRLTRATR